MTSRTLCVLVHRPGRPPEDVSVTFTSDHRVSDLAAALAADLAEPAALRLLDAGGAVLDLRTPIQDTDVRHGDHLFLVPYGEPSPVAVRPALELRVLSGAAAGQRLPLPGGRRSLGRGQDCDLRILDPSVSRSPAWIVVENGAVLLERTEGRQAVRVQGRPLAPPSPLPVGQVLEMGEALLTVAEGPVPRPPGRRGSIPLVRPPRATPAYRAPSLVLPPTPPRPGGPPLPTWAAGWRDRRRVARYRRRAEPVTGRIPALLADEERARRAMVPDASELADRANRSLPSLWERRPGDPDFLRLGLGRGDVPSWVGIGRPAGGDDELIDAALHDLLPGPDALRGARVSIDLAAHRVLAVTGVAEAAGLARWLVLQAACLHAPGDLRIAAALVSAEGWEWLHWLPHTAPAGIESATRLLGTGDRAERLVTAISTTVGELRVAGPTLLAIVDDACPGVEPLVEAVLRAPDAGVVLLVLGPSQAAPAAVGVVSARNELRLGVQGSDRIQIGVPDQVSPSVAAEVARDLAAIDDGVAAPAPGLLEVSAAPSPAGELRDRWAADAGRLDAVLGSGPDGAVEIDVAAGPHALVAGGTRLARSSLLCSWVAALALRHSPRWLNVLLLDPAAGAPWRDLAALPHVAAPPPETDGAIAELVAALLREAERRRQALIEAGARDVAQWHWTRPDEAPANLLVVVDGYDLLAARRPDVEDRLARLVELSTGLGVHVVFSVGAGNRPLPGPVRRLAGIRIDLDAGDRSDETVLGVPAAAAAGAARVTIAEGVSTGFRVPDVGHRSAGEDGSVQVRRLPFGGDGARLGGGADLTALVDAARVAARDLPALADRVWRPLPRAAPAEAPAGAAMAAASTRVELRLTVASPPQPARDVAVELGLERTFGDLVAALVAQLGLAVTSSVTVYHPRRRVWLRPDQTIRSIRLRAGDVLVVAPRSFDVEAAYPAPPDPIDDDGRVDDRGRIVVNRPPRPGASEPDLQVHLEAPPERGQGSWRALMPVGTGVLMGLMLGASTYAISGPGRQPGVVLLSAGMTPLMALLTGILPANDALKRRRAFRRAARRWRERLERLDPEVESARSLEASFLLDGAPDAATLLERARTLDPALWERRPGSPDWLRLRIGMEDVASHVSMDFDTGGDQALRAEAERRIGDSGAILTVPMVLPLAESGSAGLYGDRSGVGALARSLVAQVALLHSPGEVVVAAAVPASEQRHLGLAALAAARRRTARAPARPASRVRSRRQGSAPAPAGAGRGAVGAGDPGSRASADRGGRAPARGRRAPARRGVAAAGAGSARGRPRAVVGEPQGRAARRERRGGRDPARRRRPPARAPPGRHRPAAAPAGFPSRSICSTSSTCATTWRRESGAAGGAGAAVSGR